MHSKPSTAFKALFSAVLISSFVIVGCNSGKETKEESATAATTEVAASTEASPATTVSAPSSTEATPASTSAVKPVNTPN